MSTSGKEVGHILTGESSIELLGRPFSEYIDIMRIEGIENDEYALEMVDYVVRNTVVNALAENLPFEDLVRIYDVIRRLILPRLEDKLSKFVVRWRAFADVLDSRMGALMNSPKEAGFDPELVKRRQEQFLLVKFGRTKLGMYY